MYRIMCVMVQKSLFVCFSLVLVLMQQHQHQQLLWGECLHTGCSSHSLDEVTRSCDSAGPFLGGVLEQVLTNEEVWSGW